MRCFIFKWWLMLLIILLLVINGDPSGWEKEIEIISQAPLHILAALIILFILFVGPATLLGWGITSHLTKKSLEDKSLGEINNLKSEVALLKTEREQLKEKLANTDALVDLHRKLEEKGGKYLNVISEMDSLDLRILKEFYKAYDLKVHDTYILPESTNVDEFIAEVLKRDRLKDSEIGSSETAAGVETLLKLNLLKDETRRLESSKNMSTKEDGSHQRGISYQYKNTHDGDKIYQRDFELTAVGREIAKMSLNSRLNPSSDTSSQTSAS